jgi:hypothetical protein
MPDYSKSKVYKITGGGLTYIGSTIQALSQRLAKHRYDKLNYPEYGTTVFPILDFPDCCITLIEDCPCERKEQKEMRERYWIENTVCVNKMTPLQTKKEYRIKNREKILEEKRVYRINNKADLLAKDKLYKEQNKEIIKVKQKEYYQNNKEAINARCREKKRLKRESEKV